jgi:hypothetical protein
MSDGKNVRPEIRILRILVSLFKIQGMQAKMMLLLSSGEQKRALEYAEEIATQLESVGARLNFEIDTIAGVMDVTEGPDA